MKGGNVTVTGKSWKVSTHRLILQISFPVLEEVDFDSLILAETDIKEFQAVLNIAINFKHT